MTDPSTGPNLSTASSSGVAKKKFAAPPVKSACLACRAARTRCDGSKPCATCQSRSRECIYTPSRRGGPRARKKPRVIREPAADEEPRQIPDDVFAMLSQEPATAQRQREFEIALLADSALEVESSFDFEFETDALLGGPGRRRRSRSSSNKWLTNFPSTTTAISLPNYIDPGAGLKHLEDYVPDSDFIFDSLFMNSHGPIGDNGFAADVSGTGTPSHAPVPMVRTYKSDAAILNAYYVFIHPFFPILPPQNNIPLDQPIPHLQNQIDVFDDGFEPTSPIALAISAILALIPCAEDTQHQHHESKLFRRKYAQYFAQSAFETIENDEEIPDSAIAPHRALSAEDGTQRQNFRRPFHARVPIELETIIALDILSVYEYSQRGNLKKMQKRAGQALMTAMDLGLQSCTIEDEFSEARRRAWWMTYICTAQGNIVSSSKPNYMVYSPSYLARLPTLLADPEAFAVYLQAQRAILAASQFVIELNTAVKEGADMNPIYEKMKELEAYLEPLLTQSESWLLLSTTTSPVNYTEEVVARSLRSMARIKLNSARIKLHRYCAFFDIPVFSRKHCDLQSFNSTSPSSSVAADNNDEPRQWPACSCSTFANPFNLPTPAGSSTGAAPTTISSAGLSPSSSSAATDPTVIATPPASSASVAGTTTNTTTATNINSNVNKFPFSSHQSAKICLKSALNIAHSFDDLPYPNPTGIPQQEEQGPPMFLSHASTTVCPRTMPSFACCAMQCAYALLMVHQKTKTMYPYSLAVARGSVDEGRGGQGGGPGGTPVAVNSLLMRLQQGLTSIHATLANYATAFEALGGMRDQIKSAIDDSSAFTL